MVVDTYLQGKLRCHLINRPLLAAVLKANRKA